MNIPDDFGNTGADDCDEINREFVGGKRQSMKLEIEFVTISPKFSETFTRSRISTVMVSFIRTSVSHLFV